MEDLKSFEFNYINKYLPLMVAILLLLACFAFSILTGSFDEFAKMKQISPMLIRNSGWIFIGLFIIIIYKFLKVLSYRVLLDKNGLTFNNRETVYWKEVKNIQLVQKFDFKYVVFSINDESAKRIKANGAILSHMLSKENELNFNTYSFDTDAFGSKPGYVKCQLIYELMLKFHQNSKNVE